MKGIIFLLTVAWLAVHKAECACTYRTIRLYNGTAANNDTGMLQICDGVGRWTAVCDYRWTQSLSVKACKELGHTNPKPITTINSYRFWNRFGFVNNYGTCRSNYQLARCLSNSSINLYRTYLCNRNRDTIVLECYRNTSGCVPNTIRLYNTSHASTNTSGMVQICNSQGRWTAVCDFSWGCNEAVAACRQLGYNNPRPRYTPNGGPWTEYGFGPYSYCRSSATSLFQCSSYSSTYRSSTSYCNPFRDTVKLECVERSNSPNNTCSPNYSVRLVNGTTESEGRVEFCYNRKWTTFCGLYYISQKAAATMCNALGFRGNSFATPIYDGRFGVGLTEEYSTRLYCRAEYNRMQYCSVTIAGSGTCTSQSYCNSNRLGLRCYEPQNCNEGDVRLVNGVLEKEGRLEVCANGVWGMVCSTSFALSAAYVACKQVGHLNVNGAVIDKYGKYGIGDGPIVYNALACFGHEETLESCQKTVYPNFYCAANRVIGLRCLDMCDEGDVRLVDGSHPYQGTVEVCVDKAWSLIAQHGWDDADARVICRQIGGYNATAGVAVLDSFYGRPKSAIRYSNVYCRGDEDEVADCTHHEFNFEFGRTYNASVAGVDCGLAPTYTVPTRQSTSSTQASTSSTQASTSSTTSSATSFTRPTTSSTAGPFISRQSPLAQKSTNNESSSVFISGIFFFAIGISVLVIAIIVMVCVILRMKKLSMKNNNSSSISAVQRMSDLEDSQAQKGSEYVTKAFPSSVSFDEELLS